MLGDDAFFLQHANSLSAQVHGDFLAINNKSFLLQVWFPGALSMTHRKADIVAKLLAFAGKFTGRCHEFYLS